MSPTVSYYQKLFPKHFNAKVFLIGESIELKSEIEEVAATANPCETLDKLSKSQVTNPNLNSAVIRITVNGNTYLFTGDAGIDTFYNIPNYKEVLKNIFWLKIPHHGSRNNINCELIKLMSPNHGAVSGNKRIDSSVVDCFINTGCEVKTTRDLNSIVYEF